MIVYELKLTHHSCTSEDLFCLCPFPMTLDMERIPCVRNNALCHFVSSFQIIISTAISYGAKLNTNFGVSVVGDIPSGWVPLAVSLSHTPLQKCFVSRNSFRFRPVPHTGLTLCGQSWSLGLVLELSALHLVMFSLSIPCFKFVLFLFFTAS